MGNLIGTVYWKPEDSERNTKVLSRIEEKRKEYRIPVSHESLDDPNAQVAVEYVGLKLLKETRMKAFLFDARAIAEREGLVVQTTLQFLPM